MKLITPHALPRGSAPRRAPVRRLVSVASSPAATAGARGALEQRRDISEADAYALAECADGAPDPIENYAARRGE